MCELMGMSFNKPVRPALTFRGFRQRSNYNPDGWGIAFYPDEAVQVIKEPIKGNQSILSKFVRDYPLIESQQIIAHVRVTSCGAVTYKNTHPFHRECAGRDYVFAHNGTLNDFRRNLALAEFLPIGQTDSEHAFCHLLSAISQRQITVWNREEFDWLWQKFKTINQLGKFNCLMSDGQLLFCYHDQNCYNGLSLLERCSPFGAVRLLDEDYEIDLEESKDPEQRGYIIASHPLTNENWQRFRGGELKVFNNGSLIYSSRQEETREGGNLNALAIEVLRFIRNADHAVELAALVRGTSLSNNEVRPAVKQLLDKNYLQQHSRDAVNWDHLTARFFTCEAKRPEIDLLIKL